jgi:PAS domain S-box-containing protein
MTELRFPGQAPSQVARHFLDLLNDVYRIHGLFLEEIATLRARVAELEAAQTPNAEGHGSLAGVSEVPGCALYLVDQDGKIQSWSEGAREIYGYSVEEVLDRCPDLLKPHPTPGAASGPDKPDSLRASRRLRKDGRVFEVCLYQTALLDKNGQACGRMHVEIPWVLSRTALRLRCEVRHDHPFAGPLRRG